MLAIRAQLRPARPAAGLRPSLHDPETLAADGTDTALTRLAAYATLAPSPHNTQPWRFRAAGGSLTISPDPSRTLAVADPQRRAMTISLGCSGMSVLVAAAAAGLGLTVEATPDGGVRLGVAGTEADPALARLFPALTARVTDKRGYPSEPVEPPHLPMADGIGVVYVADPGGGSQDPSGRFRPRPGRPAHPDVVPPRPVAGPASPDRAPRPRLGRISRR